MSNIFLMVILLISLKYCDYYTFGHFVFPTSWLSWIKNNDQMNTFGKFMMDYVQFLSFTVTKYFNELLLIIIMSY